MVSLYNQASSDLPPTPNIEALFGNGVLFENAWTNPICSPTRATMLTGRYGFRTGVGDVVKPVDAGIQLDELTLPEAISAGSPFNYTHANIGKWHLSSRQNGQNENPNLSGYDHFSGLLRGGLQDYSSWQKAVNGAAVDVTTYATTENVDDALNWIETQQQQAKPWFLWLAFNAPHSPFHLPPAALHSFDDLPATGAEPYAYYKAMVEAMDTEIGRLLDSLPADVRANTTVIFIGDNGSPSQVAQPPLTRGRAKGSLYDGGVHVPLIVSGPKVVDPGRRSAALVNSVDIFATVLELTDAELATTLASAETVDSVSLLPYLTNTIHPAERDWIFAERFGTNERADYAKTIRNDRYKLIVFEDGRTEFYDLQNDVYENNNLYPADGSFAADQQKNFCDLSANLIDLLASEPDQAVPMLPNLCQ